LTLAPETVRWLDHAVAEGRYASRSEAVGEALAGWVREESSRARDSEIDAYYDALTAAEVEEDQEWARLGLASLTRDESEKEAHAKRVHSGRTAKATRRRGEVRSA